MKRCDSCEARIKANILRENAPLRGMASNDCICNPLDFPTYRGASMLPDQGTSNDPLGDPGWRDDQDADGLWSVCLRKMEDAV